MNKRFYPVVHIHNFPQTFENVKMAKDLGGDGVFLIDHRGHPLSFLVEEMVAKFQDADFFIGVNYLGVDNLQALQDAASLGCKMLWSDNAEMDEEDYQISGERLLELQQKLDVRFFGGVHFKYQRKPKRSIGESLRRAVRYVEYPTLSGRATGVAADLDFIREAHSVFQQEVNNDNRGLAIASGISTDNVELYLPYIDAFLVASSIINASSDDEYFDPSKLGNLRKKIK